MPTLRQRKAVIWFSKLMEEVLKENDYKNGWNNCSNAYLIRKLNEEVDELKLAIHDNEGSNIIREAVDVANIAMIIADNNS